jgi:hypothetical protein
MKSRLATTAVKAFIAWAAYLGPGSTSMNAQSWQDASASAFTNAKIIWQVPSNSLPQKLWVYRRLLPQVFSGSILSNAVVLASLEKRGIPSPSKDDFFITKQEPPNWPAPIPTLLFVSPKDASLNFTAEKFTPISPNAVPSDEAVTSLARAYAPRLGLNPTELKQGRVYLHFGDEETNADKVFGKGINFPRQLDGIGFFSASDTGDVAEGFSMEFGRHGKIQAFSLRWSDVRRNKNENVFTEDQMADCIRAHKMIVLPNFTPDDFIRLKSLAETKTLVIKKITLYYNLGMIPNFSEDNTPAKWAIPFVELEGFADVQGGNLAVKILCPIVKNPSIPDGD